MPLDEVFVSVGVLLPAQAVKPVPNEKLGVIFGVTVIVKLVLVAQSPGVGVNV